VQQPRRKAQAKVIDGKSGTGAAQADETKPIWISRCSCWQKPDADKMHLEGVGAEGESSADSENHRREVLSDKVQINDGAERRQILFSSPTMC